MSTDTKQYHEVRGFVSPKSEKWIKGSAITAMIIVALSSAVLSFTGLQKLALDSKIPEQLAFLFPIAVDVTILMGSLAVLLYEMFGIKAVFGWFTVLFGTLLSVTGNVISVANEGIIAQVLHGIIPVLLCISLESLLRILRFNIKKTVTEIEVSNKANSAESEDPSVSQDGHDESTNILNPVQSAPLESYRTETLLDVPEDSAEPIENNALETVPAIGEDKITEPDLKIVPLKKEITKQTEIRTEIKNEAVAKTPVFNSLQTTQDKKKEEHPTVPKPRSSSAKRNNASNLDDFQLEMLQEMVSVLPSDLSESKKLAHVLKKQPNLKGQDIRYIMKYPADKRVDSLLKRARDIALSENS